MSLIRISTPVCVLRFNLRNRLARKRSIGGTLSIEDTRGNELLSASGPPAGLEPQRQPSIQARTSTRSRMIRARRPKAPGTRCRGNAPADSSKAAWIKVSGGFRGGRIARMRGSMSAEHSPVRSLVIPANSAVAFELAASLGLRTAKKACVDRYNLTLQPKCDS